MLLFFVVILLLQVGMIFFRLLDEIFFPNYRKTAIKNPVFIISSPRSGTSHLHSLLCLDEERYTYFMLYHTFFPSILFYKMILLLKWIDKHIGFVIKRFFTWLEKILFKGWDGIHSMGCEKSEEDEGIFVLQMMSPAIALFCPWLTKLDWITITDNLNHKKKKQMMSFYKNTLKRFVYAWGKDKVFLAKNVISTGRINMLLETFPDAKVIYPVRNPYNTIPSMVSMFTAPYSIIAPEIPENSQEFRAWGNMVIAFYKHFMKEIRKHKPDRLYACKYDDLIADPKRLIQDIYHHFNFELSPEFEKRLQLESEKSRV